MKKVESVPLRISSIELVMIINMRSTMSMGMIFKIVMVVVVKIKKRIH